MTRRSISTLGSSTCPHCGRELDYTDLTSTLSVRTMRIYKECDCEGARREREEAAERERRAAEEAEAARRRSVMESCGMPLRYSLVPPDTRLAERVLNSTGLYMHGPVGTGKTFRACAVLRSAIEEFGVAKAVFTTVPDLLTSLRGLEQGAERRVIGRCCSADVLVLDDLGKGSPTEWALKKLYQIVNFRYRNMRTMVVTSQYCKQELGSRLGSRGDTGTAEAIVSRLVEACATMAFDGTDRRIPR